jgi:hypothetical protein
MVRRLVVVAIVIPLGAIKSMPIVILCKGLQRHTLVIAEV